MRLVAVDPGSYDCGLAMWEGEDLCRLHTLRARGRLGVRRAGVVLAGIEAWLDEWRPEVLVVEKPPPNPQRPVPLLRALYDSLRSLARERGLAFESYLPGAYLKRGSLDVAIAYLAQQGRAVSRDEAAAYLLGEHYLAQRRVRAMEVWN